MSWGLQPGNPRKFLDLRCLSQTFLAGLIYISEMLEVEPLVKRDMHFLPPNELKTDSPSDIQETMNSVATAMALISMRYSSCRNS